MSKSQFTTFTKGGVQFLTLPTVDKTVKFWFITARFLRLYFLLNRKI